MGEACEVSSLNIAAKAWVKKDDRGVVVNPYSQLPELASDLSPAEQQAELAGIEADKGRWRCTNCVRAI